MPHRSRQLRTRARTSHLTRRLFRCGACAMTLALALAPAAVSAAVIPASASAQSATVAGRSGALGDVDFAAVAHMREADSDWRLFGSAVRQTDGTGKVSKEPATLEDEPVVDEKTTDSKTGKTSSKVPEDNDEKTPRATTSPTKALPSATAVAMTTASERTAADRGTGGATASTERTDPEQDKKGTGSDSGETKTDTSEGSGNSGDTAKAPDKADEDNSGGTGKASDKAGEGASQTSPGRTSTAPGESEAAGEGSEEAPTGGSRSGTDKDPESGADEKAKENLDDDDEDDSVVNSSETVESDSSGSDSKSNRRLFLGLGLGFVAIVAVIASVAFLLLRGRSGGKSSGAAAPGRFMRPSKARMNFDDPPPDGCDLTSSGAATTANNLPVEDRPYQPPELPHSLDHGKDPEAFTPASSLNDKTLGGWMRDANSANMEHAEMGPFDRRDTMEGIDEDDLPPFPPEITPPGVVSGARYDHAMAGSEQLSAYDGQFQQVAGGLPPQMEGRQQSFMNHPHGEHHAVYSGGADGAWMDNHNQHPRIHPTYDIDRRPVAVCSLPTVGGTYDTARYANDAGFNDSTVGSDLTRQSGGTTAYGIAQGRRPPIAAASWKPQSYTPPGWGTAAPEDVA